MATKSENIIEEIPISVKNTDVLKLIDEKRNKAGAIFLALKDLTGSTDEDISDWLNISVKTYRRYKNPLTKIEVRADLHEHTIMLVSLFKHGKKVFGDHGAFSKWLNKENFFFGKKKPVTFLNTISGIKFIDSRLTGIEFGDNV